ncbi:hypothetical protein XENOCAPTIV_029683 [Xenoophorus captivus]|uniref:Uncharacterized protein n=1 Tax=Xenoophorus captivus TaxID=1517983 RepID=A0ABV0RW18_9TELE
MTLEKQLLPFKCFFFYLGRVISPISNNLKSINLQREQLFTSYLFKTVANVPRIGPPSRFTPSSDHAMLRKTATNIQDGNDPKHSNKSTIRCLKKKIIKVAQWSSQSPDNNLT